jgi:phosphoglycerate dehydrogenase-like enzyme
LRNQTVWRSYLDAWPSCGGVSPRTAVRTRSLRGKQLGIHGFGAVARELIKMLQPFGVAISAYSSGVPAHLFEEYGVRRSKNLSELFSTSDIIIECEALTPTSKGSINEEVLRCLPDGAVFVNVGRGDVVDEEALVRVAAERDLRLGIDVFSHEPLAGDSPLRTLPQALLSPHIAGPTEDSFADLWEFAMSNLRRYLAGESIEGLVTLEVFDRST